MSKRIIVKAAPSMVALDHDGAWVDELCDTIAQAKKRAKYFLTEDFMNRCESTTRMNYAQVVVNNEVHSDFSN